MSYTVEATVDNTKQVFDVHRTVDCYTEMLVVLEAGAVAPEIELGAIVRPGERAEGTLRVHGADPPIGTEAHG